MLICYCECECVCVYRWPFTLVAGVGWQLAACAWLLVAGSSWRSFNAVRSLQGIQGEHKFAKEQRRRNLPWANTQTRLQVGWFG